MTVLLGALGNTLVIPKPYQCIEAEPKRRSGGIGKQVQNFGTAARHSPLRSFRHDAQQNAIAEGHDSRMPEDHAFGQSERIRRCEKKNKKFNAMQ